MHHDAAVQAYDWIDTTNLSAIVANFARAHILVSLFDGDPDKWIDFIAADGTAEERERDLPFAMQVKERLVQDPQHVDHIRSLVHAFSRLLS